MRAAFVDVQLSGVGAGLDPAREGGSCVRRFGRAGEAAGCSAALDVIPVGTRRSPPSEHHPTAVMCPVMQSGPLNRAHSSGVTSAFFAIPFICL